MSEKANVPQIRFAGFADPWEQRKFIEFVTASGTRNTEGLDLRSYSVSNDKGFVPQNEQFEHGGTMAEADKRAYWIVEPGSFAYNPARINVGSIGYLSTTESVIVSSLYEVFKSDQSVDDSFLWHWFKSPFFTKQIELYQEGGVRLYFFFDKLLKSDITMPGIAEQHLIGSFFSRLDRLITLHQRKYDKLCTLKKSMLEKMFPKEGEVFPEIRFAGFADPWEQRKLGEITDVLSASRVHKDEWKTVGVPFYRSSDVVSAFKGIDNEKVFISTSLYENLIKTSGRLGKDDILVTGGGSIGIPYIVPDDEPLYSKDADLIWVKKSPNYDSTYLYAYFTSQRFREYIDSISHVGTIGHYTIEQVKDTFVPLGTIMEQQLIGSFFSRLDRLITLHQRKLDLLHNIKKSLLDRMFVSEEGR